MKLLGLVFILIGIAGIVVGIIDFSIFLILISPIVLFAGWVMFTFTKERVEKYATIPEKVGERSYIDNDTGIIYLRSHDYHTRFGEEWVVSNSSVTIRKNINNNAEIVPISKIQSMKIKDSVILSFNTLQEFTHDPSGDGSWGMEKRIESRLFAIILLHLNDSHIVQAVCDRVTNATIK